MEMTREDAARKVGHSQDAAAEGFPVWGWQPGQGWTGPVESMKVNIMNLKVHETIPTAQTRALLFLIFVCFVLFALWL